MWEFEDETHAEDELVGQLEAALARQDSKQECEGFVDEESGDEQADEDGIVDPGDVLLQHELEALEREKEAGLANLLKKHEMKVKDKMEKALQEA